MFSIVKTVVFVATLINNASGIFSKSGNNKTKHILGIFDLCLDKPQQSYHNQIAVIKNNMLESIFKSLSYFEYKHYDVCENMWLLQEVISDLLLTDYFYDGKSEPLNMKDSSVVFIISHVNDDLSRFLASMSTAFESLIRIDFANHYMNKKQKLFQNKDTVTDPKNIMDVLECFQWKYVGIIFLNSTAPQTEIYRRLYKKFVMKIIRKACYALSFVDIDNGRKSYEQLFMEIRNDERLKFIFLFGKQNHVVS